jgi:hypothetical protein
MCLRVLAFLQSHEILASIEPIVPILFNDLQRDGRLDIVVMPRFDGQHIIRGDVPNEELAGAESKTVSARFQFRIPNADRGFDRNPGKRSRCPSAYPGATSPLSYFLLTSVNVPFPLL